MAASVEQLLMAARAKRSPFQSLVEGLAQGMGQGQAGALERMKAEMEMERQRRADEEDQRIRSEIAQAQEDQTRGAFKKVGVTNTPAHPAARLQEKVLQTKKKYTKDAQGRYREEFEVVEPAVKEPANLEAMLAQKVASGEMTMEQAFAMKSKGQGGETPALAYQKQKDKAKEERDIQELQVPGYQLGSNVRPTQKEAQDLRDASGALKDFVSGVERMKQLINQYGSTNTMGDGSGEMETLAANLKLNLKEVQKLGVLSASDIAFLEAQVFDPSRVKSLGTTTKTALKQLDTVRGRAESLLAEALKARGYTPAAAPSTGQGGKIRVSNGQETLLIDPADEAEAAKDGFRRAS